VSFLTMPILSRKYLTMLCKLNVKLIYEFIGKITVFTTFHLRFLKGTVSKLKGIGPWEINGEIVWPMSQRESEEFSK
jgi:hypothetical protein